MTDIKELTENDLLNPSGGGGEFPSDHFEGVTRMKCDNCNFCTLWEGNFMNDYLIDCPECYQHCFHGECWIRREM